MTAQQNNGGVPKLTLKQQMGILLPFAWDKIKEQISCVWFVLAYLIVFQILVLGLPIVYSLMIATGIAITIIGLAFFMEGLRLGLMPLGETLGSTLPRKKILGIPCLPTSLAFGFVLGMFATFAEPAIGVLRAAGAGVDPNAAPLLWTILNTGAAQLVNMVGFGVGIAVLLGVLRFYKGWSLKPFIYGGVIILSALTLYFQFTDPKLKHVLGLAWDCGAVTTGPVTVPLVLALGIGVCRIVSSGGSSNTGFGVVTLASLFPILAVMTYALMLYKGDKYFNPGPDSPNWEKLIMAEKIDGKDEYKPGHKEGGARPSDFGKNYPKDLKQYAKLVADERKAGSGGISEEDQAWSLKQDDLDDIQNSLEDTGKLPEGYALKWKVNDAQLNPVALSEEEGARLNLEVSNAKVYVVSEGYKTPDEVWNPESDLKEAFTNGFNFFPNTYKPEEDKNGNGKVDEGEDFYTLKADGTIDYSKGDGKVSGPDQDRGALEGAIWAIVPLCSILLIVLMVGLRQKPKYLDELIIGIACAVTGMCLFSLGISLGLSPLGSQLGQNVVSTFERIIPWGAEGFVDPMFASTTAGKCLAILFGFILGYGATLAEPALNALGSTVEKITVGAFKKSLLMQAVALGVALGIGTGVAKIAFNLELWYLLLPPYTLLLILTFLSSEDFVNFGWDSAGVTTGPITVPLVLAMGLGIGSKTGAIDGFGVLSLASVGPILTVLTVGLIVKKKPKKADEEEEATQTQAEAA